MARRRGDASWEQYRLIADSSSDVVYEIDTTGAITWVSPTVSTLIGWSVEDLRGVPARSLVHPDDLEMADRLRTTLLEEPSSTTSRAASGSPTAPTAAAVLAPGRCARTTGRSPVPSSCCATSTGRPRRCGP